MHEAEKLNLEQIEAFLNASQAIRFEGENREQVYGWVEQVLRQQQYPKQGRKARGLLRRYLEKMTGLSRAQVTRLIARYQASSTVQAVSYRRHRFAQRYTRADIELLAAVDEAHETLSGPATRRILEREYQQYGKPEYERLATISVAHLYNLRRHQRYRERRLTLPQDQAHDGEPSASGGGPIPQAGPAICGWTRCTRAIRTRPKASTTSTLSMKSRSGKSWPPPSASARPGWSRCWPRCCASFLSAFAAFIPTTAASSSTRPVARLLNKLLIEQTKSRPRHSNDNGLVETKNGAIIRKHMGYGYIAGEHAPAIHRFYAEHLNPYLNYHRPCAQADLEVDEKGRQRRHYRRYQTPLETLLALPQPAQYLRDGLTVATLQRIAAVRSDTEAAQQMQHAKRQLFEQFRPAALGRWK